MAGSVLIGMSGGVDSAATAALLISRGYSVTGLYLIMTPEDSEKSPSAQDAGACAASLGIPFFTADRRERFAENVRDYFINEYLAGRTPNPCVMCNPLVKLSSLCEEADAHGCEHIATGHYARILNKNSKSLLYRSPSKKDQSYFLYRLGQKILSRCLLPLGDFSSKDEIRSYAESAGIPVAKKKDSLEICFIKDGAYTSYITRERDLTPHAGDFLDIGGNKIGTHRGIIYYTPGQRKGLGAFGKPMYVKNINAADNTVTLCTDAQRYSRVLTADNCSWIIPDATEKEYDCEIKVRSTALPAKAHVILDKNSFSAEFFSDVLAVSPGQSAVIYDGDRVIGGGIITSAY